MRIPVRVGKLEVAAPGAVQTGRARRSAEVQGLRVTAWADQLHQEPRPRHFPHCGGLAGSKRGTSLGQ